MCVFVKLVPFRETLSVSRSRRSPKKALRRPLRLTDYPEPMTGTGTLYHSFAERKGLLIRKPAAAYVRVSCVSRTTTIPFVCEFGCGCVSSSVVGLELEVPVLSDHSSHGHTTMCAVFSAWVVI